jgi:hypothetical protein
MFPATATLMYSDLGSVLLTLADPWLIRGPGSHRLTFPLTSYASWLEDQGESAWTPMLLTGSVYIDLPAMQWLGSVSPQTLSLRGWQAGGDDLGIVVSDQQLFAIEAARAAHDDVRLRLKLQGTLLAAGPDVHPVHTVDMPVSIQAARWRELLDQVGHGVGITLFIPSPLTDDGSPLSIADDDGRTSYGQATNRLRQARDHLRGGDYEESVASCRRVLEVLSRLTSLPTDKEVSAVRARDRTQEQRWAAMYYAAFGLASGAHHDDESTVEFTWTRVDADAALAATAGLLRRYIGPPSTTSG